MKIINKSEKQHMEIINNKSILPEERQNSMKIVRDNQDRPSSENLNDQKLINKNYLFQDRLIKRNINQHSAKNRSRFNQTSKDDFFPLPSRQINGKIVKIQSSIAFQLNLAGLIYFALVMIICSNLTSVYSLNVGDPLRTLYYDPSLIQAGIFLYFIQIGSHKYIQSEDKDPGSLYEGHYTITLKHLQLQNRLDYEITYSFKCLYYSNPHSGVFFLYAWLLSQTTTNFILILGSSNQLQFNWTIYLTTLNYLIVSKSILNTMEIIIKQYTHYPFACNGLNNYIECIQNIVISLPSINYHVFVQIQNYNVFTQNSSAGITPYFKLQGIIININLIQIKYSSRYLNHQALGYTILLIGNQLFNFNIKRPIMFNYQSYLHPGSITSFQSFTINFASKRFLFQQNTFVGLSSSKGNPIHYQINLINPEDTQVSGNIWGIGNFVALDVISFYGFTEVCPTYTMAYGCQLCPDYCNTCDVAPYFYCLICQKSFTLATDMQSCYCPSPFTILERLCGVYPATGCLSSYLLSNDTGSCSFCDISKKLILKNNDCICKDGFKLDHNDVCQDFCGDGIIYESKCDDGNNVSNDGCSKDCLKEDGFQCDTSIAPSFCRSEIILRYSIGKILKKENENVAALHLKIQNQINLPFAVLKQNFQPLPSHLELKIVTSQNPYRQIIITNLKLLSIDQSNQLQLQFPFKFTIEGFNGEINLNYENTKYKNQTQKLNFILAGDNQGLKFQENIGTYKSLGYSMMGGTILNIICLVIGFFTPKFIGLESILTFQLLYFSQLLIVEVQKWPPGFSFLKYVKFTGGYNQLIEITQIMPLSQISKKASNLSLKMFFIENFNTNFIIIFLSSIFLIVIMILRNRIEKQVIQIFKASLSSKNSKSETISAQMKQKMKQSLIFYNKINQIAFWIANQVAIWLILPFLFAISYEFMVPNDEYQIINSSISGYIFLKIRGIQSFLSLFMILCIGCNNFVNFWLSLSSLNVLLERPQEIIYKRALFVYLLVVGCLVLFFNSASFGSAYCSALVLAIQAAYIVVLIRIDPYKQSLRVHTVVLLFNNAVFLVFLIVINLINYVEDLSSSIILGISYFVTGCAGISIILTFVRLYYELRYGRALQEKIQEQRNRKKQQQRLKKQMLLKKNQQLLQIEAKQKLSEQQRIRGKNTFLFQNQIKQGKQKDLLKWLDKRHLTQKQKDAYYFKQFTQKPLNWMRKHDRQKFLQRKMQLQDEQKIRQKRQMQKRHTPQFLSVVQNIKISFEKNKINRVNKK